MYLLNCIFILLKSLFSLFLFLFQIKQFPKTWIIILQTTQESWTHFWNILDDNSQPFISWAHSQTFRKWKKKLPHLFVRESLLMMLFTGRRTSGSMSHRCVPRHLGTVFNILILIGPGRITDVKQTLVGAVTWMRVRPQLRQPDGRSGGSHRGGRRNLHVILGGIARVRFLDVPVDVVVGVVGN